MNENNERINIPRIIPCENIAKNARIKVVGVGGAGGNAVNRMVKMDIPGVEFISINTDALALENSKADEKISIGQKVTKSLGAGAKPSVGREAILEDRDAVAEKLKGADLVFIAAGMGGGTGTGAAPVVAEIARELDILSVAVVSMPFKWEGPVRMRHAKNGVDTLREAADTIIVIDNQRVEKVIDKNTTIDQAFSIVDEVLGNAVRAVCDIILRHGNIHVDFSDIRTVMMNGGDALMGTGIADGEDRALRAAENAINCPLLHDVSINGAAGVLVNISHGENFTMHECSAAMEYIHESVGEINEPLIIFGDITIPELGDQVSITVIATGFGGASERVEVKETRSFAPEFETAPLPEKAKPRPTVHFADLALNHSTQAASSVMQGTVTRPTEVFSSYQDTQLDVRAISAEEDVFTRPSITAMNAVASNPTRENPSLTDESVDYSVPAFLRKEGTLGDLY